MRTTTKIITGAATALTLSGLVGVGLATADPTTSPSPAPSATTTPGQQADRQSQRQDHRGKRNLVRRALHGELTLGAKNPRVVAFQRGTVTKASTTSVTVKSADGFTATYAIASDTKVRQHQKPAAIGEIAVSDRVRVVALKDGSVLTAKRVAELRRR